MREKFGEPVKLSFCRGCRSHILFKNRQPRVCARTQTFPPPSRRKQGQVFGDIVYGSSGRRRRRPAGDVKGRRQPPVRESPDYLPNQQDSSLRFAAAPAPFSSPPSPCVFLDPRRTDDHIPHTKSVCPRPRVYEHRIRHSGHAGGFVEFNIFIYSYTRADR